MAEPHVGEQSNGVTAHSPLLAITGLPAVATVIAATACAAVVGDLLDDWFVNRFVFGGSFPLGQPAAWVGIALAIVTFAIAVVCWAWTATPSEGHRRAVRAFVAVTALVLIVLCAIQFVHVVEYLWESSHSGAFLRPIAVRATLGVLVGAAAVQVARAASWVVGPRQ
jgi:hypothetical protein